MNSVSTKLRLRSSSHLVSTYGPALAPAVLMLVLGLWGIGNLGLGNDEHCTWWAAHLAWPDFLRLLGHADAVLAPYYLLIRLCISLLGDTELVLRLPSALGMAIAAALTTQLGRRLGGTSTGFVAGLIFALTPSVSSYAQEARPYALSVATAVGSVLLLLRALDKRASWARFAAYSASVVLVGLVHLVALSVLAGQASLLLSAQREFPWLRLKRSGMTWLVAVALALGVLGPLAYMSGTQSGQLHLISMSSAELWKLGTELTQGHRFGWILLAAGALGAIRRRRFWVMLTLWALVPPVFFFLTYDTLHIFRARYFLFTLPAWSLLAAMGSSGLTRRRSLDGAIVAALVASFAVVAYPAHRSMRAQATARNGLAPFRFIGEVLAEQSLPDDAIIYGGRPGGRFHNRLGIAYALRNAALPRDILEVTKAEARGRFQSVECGAQPSCIPQDTERLWLVTEWRQADPFLGLPPRIAETIKRRFRTTHRWTFGRKWLYLLETAATSTPSFPQSEPSQDDAEPGLEPAGDGSDEQRD